MIRKKRKKNYASSKKLLASIKEKGPLGKKSPFTRKDYRLLCLGDTIVWFLTKPS